MLARVLALMGATYVTWASASANLVCHGAADVLVLMSVKPVRPCSHLIVSPENPTSSLMLKVVPLLCITVC